MTTKPTYEGLEHRVKKLKAELAECRKEKKRLEDAEEHYHRTFDIAPIGIFYYDQNGVITKCNQQLVNILGSSHERLIGFDMLQNITNKSMLAAFKQTLNGKESRFEGEYTSLTSGKTVHLKARSVPVFAHDNTVAGGVAVIEDISGDLKAAAALAESEYRLTAIVNNSQTLIYQKDKQGRYLMINKQYATLLKEEPSEILGKTEYDYFPKHWSDEIRANDLKVLETGQAMTFEEKGFYRDRLRIYISEKFPLRNASGEITSLCGVSTDITERKEIDQKLSQSEYRLRSIIDTSPALVCLMDLQGKFLLVNKTFENIFHLPGERLVGKTVYDILPADIADVLMTHSTEVIQEAKPMQFEEKIVVDGRMRHFLSAKSPLLDASNKVFCVCCISYDITDRIQAEAALQKSEEKYRGILENIEEGYYEVDLAGNLIFSNKALCDILGYPESELMGMNYRNLMDKDNAKKVFQTFNQVYTTGVASKGTDWKIIKKNGEIGDIDTSVSLIKDANGNVTGFGGMTRDVTKQKQAEIELMRSREHLRRLSQHLQSVREQERKGIARVVHDDLGQVLTAIKMELSWLNKKIPRTEKQIIQKANSTMTLVDGAIQSVRRITSELRPSLLDDLGLAAAIEWQAEDFQKRSGMDVTLTVDPPDIETNDELSIAIFRIFQEALTNIARHSQATRVKASLIKKNNIIELIVKDNGIGISTAQATDRHSFGLLGMAEQVKYHGGHLKISGIPGKGTIVNVVIPISQPIE